MPGSRDVIYRINDNDEIVFVNPDYDEFALDNDGHGFAGAVVLGRPLWDFLNEPTARELYREAICRVRDGHCVQFPLRCDSPSRRRLMKMTISRCDAAAVEFRVRTLAVEDRPAQPLLARDTPRCADHLDICGWCKQVRVGEDWKEVEDAIASLHLFEQAVLPSLSHGICDPCRDRVIGELKQP
jgi:hypothetical protein